MKSYWDRLYKKKKERFCTVSFEKHRRAALGRNKVFSVIHQGMPRLQRKCTLLQ